MKERRTQPILPVDLLIEGRPCLVVGGGSIGARKVGHLLDAGADVTVVSSTVTDDLAEPIRQGSLRHVERDFEVSDLDGKFLVFAATSDGDVNGRIVECCRERGILCSAVDRSWKDGDLVTPATIRKHDLTVTVSTGGESCRRSRLVKDHLSRHLDILSSADVMVVCLGMGAEHDSMGGRAGRETWDVADIGRRLRQLWGIHEYLLWEPGAEMELLAVVSEADGTEEALTLLLAAGQPQPITCRTERGADALAHVVRRLLSRGTVKTRADGLRGDLLQALVGGADAGWSGVLLQEWVDSAVRVCESIRNETGANGAAVADALLVERCREPYERLLRSFKSRDPLE